ncbi:cupin domain-containing protein [Sinanaerobacter chloroacetimidivorans]|uniref:DUF861 domain-containing protein n=1 Tax=Sinanaerobacter chloroacetimidivorans TaxID=2818044 RepID=A0A8J8B0P3_9FIRM|nr:cupin domain-containing protein [Sinanaerobacter chloroacetimidivorans]MBR0597384.1 DUF861 domain-containing protein [Sinanaerobacter chloroacetimidivorans]
MKKLVCAKDVEALEKQGKKVFPIDNDTIITPSAKDVAKALGIEFSAASQGCCENVTEAAKSCEGGIDSDMIYNVLKTMLEKGLLQGMFDSASDKPYVAECDSCGLKVVRGNSVKYEVLDTGNPADKVFYQEIINADDGCSMNAGFITIESCNFEWECACQELYHIVEGTLTVSVGGKVYTANPGDSVFFPKGAKVTFGSPNKMKAFYATY